MTVNPPAPTAPGRPEPPSGRRAAARVLVVMPAHNEEASIGTTIRGIQDNLPGVDVVVINDFSSDRTTEVAERHGARVVELSCNLGYGGAIQTGFKYALARGYDFVIQMDADGQHSPEDARALLAPVLAGDADVSIGSRFLGRTTYRVPVMRRLGMRVFGGIVTFVTRRRFSDPTSGYQAMNRRVMQFFALDNYPTDFPDADTIILLVLAGFRVQEIPVTMLPRTAGTSMHSNLKVFYYVSKMMLSIFMVMLRRRKLRAPSASP